MKKTPMKIMILAILTAVAMLIGTFGGLFGRGDPLAEIKDIDTLRARLQEMVASGELTQAQAQLRLAEAMTPARGRAGARQGPELTAEQQALKADLAARVQRGELTRQEAGAEWAQATTRGAEERPARNPR